MTTIIDPNCSVTADEIEIQGFTALHFACDAYSRDEDVTEIVKLLVDQ